MESNGKRMMIFPMRSVRILLVLFALVSCGPALMHYRFIEPRLDAMRFFGLLLPTDFLFLRYFAQFSINFTIVFSAVLGWSWFRPNSVRLPAALCVTIFVIFMVAYVCYTILLIAGLLAARHT